MLLRTSRRSASRSPANTAACSDRAASRACASRRASFGGFPVGGDSEPAQYEASVARNAKARQRRDARLGTLERRDDYRIHVVGRQLAQRTNRLAEKTVTGLGKDADRFQSELPQ